MIRRTRNPNDAENAVDLAKRAVLHLYQQDPDFVVGGCSDISEIISEFLRRQGYQVEAVYGAARKGRKEAFMHAWLDIEGILFDPVIFAQDGHPEKFRYKVDAEVRGVIKCDIETILDGEVEALERALL